MRIVGARFPDRRAFAAREELRLRHGLQERDIGVRRLGTTDYAVLPTDLVLAGRFPTEGAADAVRVIERHGGEVVVNREEAPVEVPTGVGRTGGAQPPQHERPHARLWPGANCRAAGNPRPNAARRGPMRPTVPLREGPDR